MMASVLALGAAGASCLLRQRPAVRHALWLLVLVKLITPPLWVFPLVLLSRDAAPTRDEALAISTEPLSGLASLETALPPNSIEDEPSVTRSWSSMLPQVELGPVDQRRLALVWLSGSLVSLTVTGLRLRRWNRLLRFIGPVSEDVQEGVDLLAHAMGIARPPRAYWFPAASAPLLWALGCRPCLIVPRKLWDRLDDCQRTTLLVHELAHLKRKDHWVRMVELLATALYWWLPLAWIARWALRDAEEQCCDAWVVWTCPDANRAYAETLLDTVDFLSETGRAVPLAASGFGHAHHLKRRLTMIMKGTTPRGLSWSSVLGMFGLAALLLPLSPTWAQKVEEKERTELSRDADVEVDVTVDDIVDDSDLEVIKRKLAEEIRQIRSQEKVAAERARNAAEKARSAAEKMREKLVDEFKARKEDFDRKSSGHAPKEKDKEPGVKEEEKEKEKEKDTGPSRSLFRREEFKGERSEGQVRLFRYHNRGDGDFRPEEVGVRITEEIGAKELDRAKIEVARARAQLALAERQLAKVDADLRAKRSKLSRSADGKAEKPESLKREPVAVRVRPEIRVHKFDLKLKDELRAEPEKPDTDATTKSKEDAKRDQNYESFVKEATKSIKEREKRMIAELRKSKLPSGPDFDKRIEMLEKMRHRYMEQLHELESQVKDFEHDPATKHLSEKLAEVLKKLKFIEDEKEHKEAR
jgi:beta-lactamase regulating signal transducer with metallopeptidase domain